MFWTALGAIFFIVAFLVALACGLGTFLSAAGSAAKGARKTQNQIDEIKRQEREQAEYDKNRIMSEAFREEKIKEYPSSVVVGEDVRRDYRKTEWKDDRKIFPTYTIHQWYFCGAGRRYQDNLSCETDKHLGDDYTTDLYKYITTTDFIDNYPEEEWCKTHEYRYISKWYKYNHEQYERDRKSQCEQWCEMVSMLVHRYIYFGECTEFRDGLIQVLMGDRDLLAKFICECHAANEWKKEYRQLYDCDNYLKDFMDEYRIQQRVNRFLGKTVEAPEDFRHYRENTPSAPAAENIKRVLDKRERAGKAEASELKSRLWWGAVFLTTIIGIIVFAVVTWGIPEKDMAKEIRQSIVAVMFLIWFGSLIMAFRHLRNAAEVWDKDSKDADQRDWFPDKMTDAGKECAKELSEKIWQHPAPYCFHRTDKW